MTIKGDLTYWLKGEGDFTLDYANKLAKELFEWLVTADVLSYLSKELSKDEVASYIAAINKLRVKVPID